MVHDQIVRPRCIPSARPRAQCANAFADTGLSEGPTETAFRDGFQRTRLQRPQPVTTSPNVPVGITTRSPIAIVRIVIVMVGPPPAPEGPAAPAYVVSVRCVRQLIVRWKLLPSRSLAQQVRLKCSRRVLRSSLPLGLQRSPLGKVPTTALYPHCSTRRRTLKRIASREHRIARSDAYVAEIV